MKKAIMYVCMYVCWSAPNNLILWRSARSSPKIHLLTGIVLSLFFFWVRNILHYHKAWGGLELGFTKMSNFKGAFTLGVRDSSSVESPNTMMLVI
jgi:hypothetical protein